MPGPFPLATLAFKITAAGISAPIYADILASLQASVKAIYGSDAYISPDAQDGQLIAILAAVINDMNNNAIAQFSQLSPSFAQGAGLSALVKLNGLRRNVASFSTANGNVVGTAGTVINGGVVADTNGKKWNLPAQVVIPGGGTIAVSVTAQEPGNIVAPAGIINKILTPVLGWQSFASTADALPGLPIETDAALRKRQAISVATPSKTALASLLAQLAAIAGVTRLAIYENTGGAPDGNGLPAHSISVVIEGGDLAMIAKTIGQGKTPGAGTYGTTVQNYVDPNTGINYAINFFVLTYTAIVVTVNGVALSGWSPANAADIQAAVAAHVNGLGIGQKVQFSRLAVPAYLNGLAEGATYEITSITLNGAGIDVPILFNKAAKMVAADVTVNIV